jgi:hypothetical protein
MNIQPTYINFSQAKLLKEKGFDVYCSNCFYKDEESQSEYHTTEEFIDISYRPEQWQVVEWLRVNHGIWVNVFQNLGFNSFSVLIYKNRDVVWNINKEFNIPQEAYSTAFDYILKELI